MLVVVVGPPAAGKSTYIAEHAQPGDIVIDFDRLAVALAPPGAPTHDHGWHLRNVALRARDAAMRSALRIASQCDVWLIHSVPSDEAVRGYRARGARFVVVDPGRRTVMKRCGSERPAEAREVAERWYGAEWLQDLSAFEGPAPTKARRSRAWR